MRNGHERLVRLPTPYDSNSGSRILSLKLAAAYLGISKAHLANVINGKVGGVEPPRTFKVGRRILIRLEWLDSWLDKTGGSNRW